MVEKACENERIDEGGLLCPPSREAPHLRELKKRDEQKHHDAMEQEDPVYIEFFSSDPEAAGKGDFS